MDQRRAALQLIRPREVQRRQGWLRLRLQVAAEATYKLEWLVDHTAPIFCSGTTNFTRVPGWVVDKVRWLFDTLNFPPVARARAIMLV
jgi:hypothetical protein